MGQEPASGQDDLPRKCVFCGGDNPVETQLWPSCIEQFFPDSELPRLQALASRGNPDGAEAPTRAAGTRRPLACAACTTGWIEPLGEKARGFLEPVLHGGRAELTAEQVKVLSGCICLVAMSAAFLTRHCGICPGDRAHLRHTGQPPKNWSLFVAGLTGTSWSRSWKHHPYRIEFAGNPLTTHSKGGRVYTTFNTQLMSMGIGPLFFHIFSTPSLPLLSDFEMFSRQQGLTQIWPAPRRFGVLPPARLRLPPELTLTDAEAGALADRFADGLHRRMARVMATAA
jgi:hypothetical protein